MARGDIHAYWIHGINVRAASDHPRLVKMTPTVLGMHIKQDRGQNWFYIALPTPLHMDGEQSVFRVVRIRGQLNAQATLRRVQLWHGPQKQIDREDLNLSDTDLDLPIPGQKALTNPLLVAMEVVFEKGGFFRLDGVGASYHERNPDNDGDTNITVGASRGSRRRDEIFNPDGFSPSRSF